MRARTYEEMVTMFNTDVMKILCNGITAMVEVPELSFADCIEYMVRTMDYCLNVQCIGRNDASSPSDRTVTVLVSKVN